jgi:foldase protein PrsA
MSAVVVAAIALSACSRSAGGGTGAGPAATVGTTQITDAQVAHEASLFRFLAGLNRTPCGTPAPGEAASSPAPCNRFALSNLIQDTFVHNYAADKQIAVTDQELTSVLSNLDTQVGKANIDKGLAAQGLTRDDLHALASNVLLAQKVQSDMTASQLGDAKLKAMYEKQLLQFTTVQVDHILVKTKAEAEQVYQQVTAPGATEKDFLALAKRVSIDPSAKQNSGSLGSAVASTYVPEFGQAAAALEPGQISKPVHSQFGWHVIRMVSKQVTPFEQAKSQLVQSQSTVVFNGWLRQQATDQGVDVNPRYGRYDLPTLTVVPITSTNPSETATPVASGSTVPSTQASPTP